MPLYVWIIAVNLLVHARSSEAVNAVYNRGCIFAVMCGGVVWQEIVGVPDDVQQEYAKACAAMCERSQSLHFKSMYEYFPAMQSAQIRAEIFHKQGHLPPREWGITKRSKGRVMDQKQVEQFKKYAAEMKQGEESTGGKGALNALSAEDAAELKAIDLLCFSEAFSRFCDREWQVLEFVDRN